MPPVFPSGIGINCHSVPIASFATMFPFAKWVRLDGISVGWNVATWQSLMTHYRGITTAAAPSGLSIMITLDMVSWGANVVGNARDVAVILKPDVLDLVNEPEINAITGATAAARAKAIYTQSLRHLAWRPFLVGPSISQPLAGDATYDDTATIKPFTDAWYAAHGDESVDADSIHGYPSNSWARPPETYLVQMCNHVKSHRSNGNPSKPVIVTEIAGGPFDGVAAHANDAGYCAVPALYGNIPWDATHCAAHYDRCCQGAAAAGMPILLYDGPWDTNAYQSLSANTGNDGTPSAQLTALQALSPAGRFT